MSHARRTLAGSLQSWELTAASHGSKHAKTVQEAPSQLHVQVRKLRLREVR